MAWDALLYRDLSVLVYCRVCTVFPIVLVVLLIIKPIHHMQSCRFPQVLLGKPVYLLFSYYNQRVRHLLYQSYTHKPNYGERPEPDRRHDSGRNNVLDSREHSGKLNRRLSKYSSYGINVPEFLSISIHVYGLSPSLVIILFIARVLPLCLLPVRIFSRSS